jgi:Anti-sigma factor NepR
MSNGRISRLFGLRVEETNLDPVAEKPESQDPMARQGTMAPHKEARLGQARIMQQLRAMYNDVVNQGVPQHLAELSSSARESARELRLPTLDERVDLYSRAVRGEHDLADEAYSVVRNRILDAMAADIAIKAGIDLSKELEYPTIPKAANMNETGQQSDLFENRRYRSASTRSLPSEPFEVAAFEASADFLAHLPVAARTSIAGLAQALEVEPRRSARRIEPRRRPALKLAIAASLCAVLIGGSTALFLFRNSNSATDWSRMTAKSDKLDVAVQPLQSPSEAQFQAAARSELTKALTATSTDAPTVLSPAKSPTQFAIADTAPSSAASASPVAPMATSAKTAGLDRPSLTNQLTREEIVDLVKRGRELIAAGKIRDARILLKRAGRRE